MSTSVRTVRTPWTAEWNSVRETVRATFHLGLREVRTVMRTRAMFIPNLIVPIFFFYVMVGSLEEFANRSGVPNWEAFQLPVAIMFAVTSGSAGLNMVADIESGYFDKLLLTPASRLSILLGAMGADFLRIVAQGLLVVAVAMITGTDFATGVVGAVVMVLIASVAGLAYSAVGWDTGEIGVALITVAALGTVTLTLALRALMGRVR